MIYLILGCDLKMSHTNHNFHIFVKTTGVELPGNYDDNICWYWYRKETY